MKVKLICLVAAIFLVACSDGGGASSSGGSGGSGGGAATVNCAQGSLCAPSTVSIVQAKS